jgi:hypothetical protein
MHVLIRQERRDVDELREFRDIATAGPPDPG